MKVKSDHGSEFSNLSNWKEEARKYHGFNGIQTCDLGDTGAMLHQLSYEGTHWERGQFVNRIQTRDLRDTGAMLHQLSYEGTHWERGQLVEFISS